MARKPWEKKQVTIYLPEEIHREVKAMAALKGRSLSGLIEWVLRKVMAENEPSEEPETTSSRPSVNLRARRRTWS